MKDTVVTIGNFDGVHRGHQEIIRVTLEQARARVCARVAFTFRPHPQSVLRPDRAPELLLTYDEKKAALLHLGVSRVVEQSFDLGFSKTTPEQFFHQILVGQLGARAIVVGYDFTFGKERSGHLQVLQTLCDSTGLNLTVIAPQRLDREVVSSSTIRQFLKMGQVHEAAELMGRLFFYAGAVVHGDQRGRGLGFPTANLALGEKLLLPAGVYASLCSIEGGTYASVTHVGVRPTFGVSSSCLAETHLLEGVWGPEVLYGQQIRVEFIQRIREERRFTGPEDLRAQIVRDIGSARQMVDAFREGRKSTALA